ncbi:MAG: T9SS type A sorting domain-containing protein, partial [Bacteroidota bacterium]
KKNRQQNDDDGDGIGNACDPCRFLDNRLDTDGDGVSDCFDNCVTEANPDQSDRDNDGHGDLCDNCPDKKNRRQNDDDGDGIGNACDPTRNGDAGVKTSKVAAFDLILYPNPVREQLRIELPTTVEELTVFDPLGRVVRRLQEQKVGASALRLNVADLEPGTYWLRARAGERVLVRKFVVVR